jgi:hypothetical protein
MLRIEFSQLADGATVKLEGRLVAGWAEHAKSLFMNAPVPDGLIVDIRDVIYVDLVGEEVLLWFATLGAKFIADNNYSLDACKRLGLPFQQETNDFTSRRSGPRGRSPQMTSRTN